MYVAEASITIRPIEGHGLATIMARKGVGTEVIAAALGIEAAKTPRAMSVNSRRLIGTGPGTWLLMDETADPGWAATIQCDLAGLASVADQSSGFALLELRGRDVRRLLQKGLSIDLNPEVFGEGCAATSVIEHIGVILWCIAAETFHIATFRSYAADFRHWLDETVKTIMTIKEEFL